MKISLRAVSRLVIGVSSILVFHNVWKVLYLHDQEYQAKHTAFDSRDKILPASETNTFVQDAELTIQDIIDRVKREGYKVHENLRKIVGNSMDTEQILDIIGNSIEKLPVQNPEKVVRAMVSTYVRAGSSFISDILQQNWKTFHHFEPLNHWQLGLRFRHKQVPDAMSVLKGVLNCNFTNYLRINATERTTFNFFYLKHNNFFWMACHRNPELCLRADFQRFVCIRSPWQVVKQVKLSMEQVGQFVLDNPDLKLRVVHMVRDPRGMFNSRKSRLWCTSQMCINATVMCSELDADYEAFRKFHKLRPDLFMQLRYEDLSTNPLEVTRRMMDFFHLPFTDSVLKFLKMSTEASLKHHSDPYSTWRNSSITPFVWKKKLSANEIKEIQHTCASVLKQYGYPTMELP